jgi:hypothetical protein
MRDSKLFKLRLEAAVSVRMGPHCRTYPPPTSSKGVAPPELRTSILTTRILTTPRYCLSTIRKILGYFCDEYHDITLT